MILTVSEQERDLLDAVAAGAVGYLVKSTPGPELRASLLRAAKGEPVFSPALAALVLGEFRKLAKASSGISPLSEREREVRRHRHRSGHPPPPSRPARRRVTGHESLGALAGVPTWAWLSLGGAFLLTVGVALERADNVGRGSGSAHRRRRGGGFG